MGEQTETTLYEIPPSGGIGYGVYTADVTAADTVVLDNFDKLIIAVCIKLEDNSEITVTIATNVVTIGAGPASDKVLIMAVGI